MRASILTEASCPSDKLRLKRRVSDSVITPAVSSPTTSEVASVSVPCLVGLSCCSAHCPRCGRRCKHNKGFQLHHCADVTQVASRTTASDRSSFQFKCENCSCCFRRAGNPIRLQPYCPSQSPSSLLSLPPFYRRHVTAGQCLTADSQRASTSFSE